MELIGVTSVVRDFDLLLGIDAIHDDWFVNLFSLSLLAIRAV